MGSRSATSRTAVPISTFLRVLLRTVVWCDAWGMYRYDIADFHSGRELDSGSLGVMGAASHDGRRLLPRPTRTVHRRWTSICKYYLRLRKACKTASILSRGACSCLGMALGPKATPSVKVSTLFHMPCGSGGNTSRRTSSLAGPSGLVVAKARDRHDPQHPGPLDYKSPARGLCGHQQCRSGTCPKYRTRPSSAEG